MYIKYDEYLKYRMLLVGVGLAFILFIGSFFVGLFGIIGIAIASLVLGVSFAIAESLTRDVHYIMPIYDHFSQKETYKRQEGRTHETSLYVKRGMFYVMAEEPEEMRNIKNEQEYFEKLAELKGLWQSENHSIQVTL